MTIAKLPREWIDRLFERLHTIYGDKWIASFGDPRKETLYKDIWSTGLTGLTAEEIRRALTQCSTHLSVPTHIEFYYFAKGLPLIQKRDSSLYGFAKGDPHLAREHLDKIKSSLKKNVPHRT